MTATADFLSLFYDPDEKISFRAIPPKGHSGTTVKEPGSIHALQNGVGLLKKLEVLNRDHGIYFVVNKGGDSDEDITRFNASFAEHDHLSIAEQHRKLDAAPLATTTRVETARSVHAYWKLKGNVDSDQWQELQRRLISFFDSDKSIRNASRVMRAPGFDHIAKDGTRTPVRCVQFEPEHVYTLADMFAAFPAAKAEPRKASAAKTPAGDYATWDALRAELGRRIMAHETATKNHYGNWDCRGICHDGEGNTSLFYMPSTNQAYCHSHCEQEAILQAFGLPERPAGIRSLELDEDAEERAAIQAEGAPNERQQAYEYAKERLGAVVMSTVEPEEVRWLWYPRIPLRKPTLIDGDPGLGKSFVTCALATAVTRGRGLPGESSKEPGRVVLLGAEDGLADTTRPRLDAMGADCSRITAISKPLTLDVEGFALLDAILENEKPRLSVIDPLFAYTGAKMDINRANETREVMSRLAAMAERHNCAIVCVRHLTKGGRDKSIYRGIGSIDLTAACRSVLLVGADANDISRRAIVQIKNNLAPLAEPIGYSLTDGVFAWTGVSDLTADQILASDQNSGDALPLDEAVEFLQSLLTSPMNQRDVKKAASKAGISERTLYRAKGKLGVKSEKIGFGSDGGWAWRLPE